MKTVPSRPTSRRALRPAAAGLAAAFLLGGCITDQSKRGTIVDNETRVGRLFLADGSKAAGARVRIYPVGHLPDTASAAGSADPAYATRTDAEGGFSVGSLAPGEYNILGEKDGAYSIQDSVFLGGAGGELPPDTLKAPGSLSGIVALQVNHNPLTAIVQVLGTYAYANVDGNGRFRLGHLAEGRYTLRVSTSEDGYTPAFAAVRVTAGRDDVLPDTLRPLYTGIPVVTGLRAEYDTAAAVVRLAWDPVDFRDFSEYIVFRDPQGSLTPGLQPLGATTAPRFDDSLYGRGGTGGILLPADTGVHLLEYRVRVRDKSDRLGLSYGSLKVAAVGPANARIQYRLDLLGFRWNAAKQADEVRIRVELSSPRRGLKHVRWSFPGGAAGDSTVGVLRDLGGAAAAADTLAFDLRRQGPFRVRFQAVDMVGSSVADSLSLPGNVAPGPKGPYAAEIVVDANEPMEIDRSAVDWDEDTLTYTARGLPAWITLDPRLGSLRVEARNAQAGTHSGIVVVAHDGRRAYEQPPLAVTVKPSAWEPGPPTPAASSLSSAVTLGDRIYLVGASSDDLRSMQVFDPATGTWTPGPDLPAEVWGASVVAASGKVFVIGGVLRDSPQGAVNTVWAYDPAGGTWSGRKPMPTARAWATAAVSGGKIHVIGGEDGSNAFLGAVEEYDPVLDAWTPKPPAPFNAGSMSDLMIRGEAVEVGGTLYMMGWDVTPSYLSSDEVRAYHPATGTWSVKKRQLARRSTLAACAAGGKIYAAGGYAAGVPSADMDVYDPATDAWSPRTPMKTPRNLMTCAEHSGRIYFFQGVGSEGAGSRVDIYHPDLDTRLPQGP